MIVKIYTDGACSGNPGPGGWGAVFTGTEKLYKLAGYNENTTNNQMELLAVVCSLERIVTLREENECMPNEYELYSDSAYVINAINDKWLEKWKSNNWKKSDGKPIKNVELWKRFYNVRKFLLDKGITVEFIKVKGHSGDTYNEYVDKLAKSNVDLAREFLQLKEER